MASLQMAEQYLRVNSLCNKLYIITAQCLTLKVPKEPSQVTFTFAGCWISQVRANVIVDVRDNQSPAAPVAAFDEEQPAGPNQSYSIFFILFYISPLLIVHKGDHPLSEPLPLFLQGQKEWPVALYGGDFYDVVRAVWRPPVLLSLVTGATVAPRKARAVHEFHCSEDLDILATAQKSVKQFILPVLRRLHDLPVCHIYQGHYLKIMWNYCPHSI